MNRLKMWKNSDNWEDTNQNDFHEEMKSRINLGNTCYYSVQNILFSGLKSKNIKIKIYRNVILLITLYGYEIWSLTLGEEHMMRFIQKKSYSD